MNNERTVFSQILDFIPKHQFRTCVSRYFGNYRVKSFSCFDQYLTMAFAQLTYRESLRDIETCLRALDEKLYRCGFRGKVSRNNLANANEKRDWRIYHDFAQVLIAKARQLYADEDFGITLKNTVYALDATVIDLCLSLFPWAQHRRHKSAVKLHTLMDLKGSIPTFVRITSGAVHETTVFRNMPLEPSAIYVMDKGYTDFNIIQFFKEQLLFCYQSKKECSLLSQVFSPNRQKHRFKKRPDNKTSWHKNFRILPDTTEANQFPRRRSATNFRVSDQQFSTGCFDCLSALQTALADRTFLQVDQAALANKVFFWYFDQCCQNSSLDRDQCLRACSDNQKGAETGAFATRNTPNSKYLTFRENLAKTSTYGKLLYY